jgi:hypothetical protein
VVSVDRPGVSVEAVKWADRSDAVVVRLCEVWGSRGPVRVTLHRPFVSVARTDLLERVVSPLVGHDGTVELELRPFELVTLAFDLGLVEGPDGPPLVPTKTRRSYRGALDTASLDLLRNQHQATSTGGGVMARENRFVFSSDQEGNRPWSPIS